MSAFEDFRKFVNDQPPERPVNHSAWSTCAVGDFRREVQGEPDSTRLREAGSWFMANQFPRSVIVGALQGVGNEANTYGKLAAKLERVA